MTESEKSADAIYKAATELAKAIAELHKGFATATVSLKRADALLEYAVRVKDRPEIAKS